jgi:hypothetical protein
MTPRAWTVMRNRRAVERFSPEGRPGIVKNLRRTGWAYSIVCAISFP